MPKAAMDHEGQLSAGQDDIRSAGQIAPVKPEAKAQPVQYLPYGDLGSGIPLGNPCHHGAPLRRDRMVLP